MIEELNKGSHRRWNPLRCEWVLVSPHRTQRPWQGQTEERKASETVAYDRNCYLCPGNMRAGGHRTPQYQGVYVFENDYAALKDDICRADLDLNEMGLVRASSERGVCRVLCFDPRHDLTLATMSTDEIGSVINEWANQEAELASRDDIQYVQIFENRGAMMGASNPHPHGQIWATENIPNDPLMELKTQQQFFKKNGTQLLLKYLEIELNQKERIVAETDTWAALVPFWAIWPFELLLLPKMPAANLGELDAAGRSGLASILKLVTAGYNRIFDAPFPYSMGFHAAPCDSEAHPEWQLHAHFYPPLLRSATVRKFMTGFELLGSPQRDISPESAAVTLRNVIEHKG